MVFCADINSTVIQYFPLYGLLQMYLWPTDVEQS